MENPETGPSTGPPNSNEASQGGDGTQNPTPARGRTRTRTKTGCKTCRKRRIKCDELRPQCGNCAKSKRDCSYSDGYVFKQLVGLCREQGSVVFPAGSGQVAGHLGQHRLGSSAQHQAIAPKPPESSYFGVLGPFGGSGMSVLSPNPFVSRSFEHLVLFRQHSPAPALRAALLTTEQQRLQGGYHTNQDGYHTRLEFFGQNPLPDPVPDLQDTPLLSVEAGFDPNFRPLNKLEEDLFLAGSHDSGDVDARGFLTVLRDHIGRDAPGMRVFSAYADNTMNLTRNDMASEYTYSTSTAGLRDRAAQAIFQHFANVTGPSMSLYERHPFDNTVRREEELPYVQHQHGRKGKDVFNLWCYTWPVLSFNHPCLLHAILALGSLQLANLRSSPPTDAMKQYALAIRRLRSNTAALPSSRTQSATLAATLLLAYFEVWLSDHTKWCNHLWGARTLFAKIHLRTMSRLYLPAKNFKIRRMLSEEGAEDSMSRKRRVRLLVEIGELDFSLLSHLVGYPVTAEEYGLGHLQVLDDATYTTTHKDIEHYEGLRDLFWWYCKMDVYQSMLGGTKLFMEYKHWTQCLPRAPCNEREAVYGTYDHLILLLGRLANFASNDVKRKQKANQAVPQQGSLPSFPGILPTQGRFELPKGFSPPRMASPQAEEPDVLSPESSFDNALREWSSILHAFAAFQQSLGSLFWPIANDGDPANNCPFGQTLRYHSYGIAGIWMNYYMGMIHLHRSHPRMPPAALQAAALSAPQTHEFALRIGRIAAGLSPSNTRDISTLMGAAFIESAFCLFVAGVQLEDDQQRHWVVQRMRDITRLTGWLSASQIAEGLESGWIKSYQMGEGNMYVPAQQTYKPASIWQMPRRIDRALSDDDGNKAGDTELVLCRSERAGYALGLLGVEDDLRWLKLRDTPWEMSRQAPAEG